MTGRDVPAKSITDQIADLIEGGAKYASGALVPAAVLAPVPTALGLAGSAAGSAVAGGAAQALDASSGQERLARDAGAALGGSAAELGDWVSPKLPNFRINPGVGVNRAWRPTAADEAFPAVAPSAISEVKTYGNPNASSNADTVADSSKAIKALQAGMDKWVDRASRGNVKISGDALAAAEANAIPSLLKQTDPEQAAALIQHAHETWAGKTFSPEQFRQFLKENNAGLDQFYSKSGAKQQAATTSGSPDAIEKARSDAIRRELYSALDPENQGLGPAEIQRRTGTVKDLQSAANRRSAAISQEKSTSSGEAWIQGPARALVEAIRGNTQNAAGYLMHPFKGPTDALISRLYEAAPDAPPIPEPSSPYMPGATSSVAGTVRALPPASSQIGVSGVTVPDLGPNSLTLRRMMSGMKLLEAPAGPQVPTTGRTFYGTTGTSGDIPGQGGTTLQRRQVLSPPTDTSYVRGVPAEIQGETLGDTQARILADRLRERGKNLKLSDINKIDQILKRQ